MNSYLLLFIVMVLWGLYPISTHYFVLQLDPVFLVSVSTLISSIPFILKLTVAKNLSKLFSKKTLGPLVVPAVFVSLGSILLFVGTKLTSGINTGLLLQTEPLYSLILGVIFFNEVFDKKRIGATAVMVAGAMVIIYKGFVSPNIGDIFILFSPLMFQIAHTLVKKLLDRGEDITLTLAARQILGGLMLLAFAFITTPSFIKLLNSPQNVGSAAFLGFYLSLVILCWYNALKKMPLSVASSFVPITAVVALLGSAFFLKETITTQHYLGFILIVSGMIWQSKLYSTKSI